MKSIKNPINPYHTLHCHLVPENRSTMCYLRYFLKIIYDSGVSQGWEEFSPSLYHRWSLRFVNHICTGHGQSRAITHRDSRLFQPDIFCALWGKAPPVPSGYSKKEAALLVVVSFTNRLIMWLRGGLLLVMDESFPRMVSLTISSLGKRYKAK